jgi:hypothetical protein
MSLMLAPYEVIADTGAFNLYTVAEQRRSVPLTGCVDLIPDLSFADGKAAADRPRCDCGAAAE